jgi:zeta-carotene desaturase
VRGFSNFIRKTTKTMTTTAADFTSESAKKQIGNDAFLNKDLMARAQNGPGVKNKEKLKIGIVGKL